MKKTRFEKKMWLKNHKINDDGVIEKFCTHCEEWKEENINNFYLMNKSKPELGFSSWCKKCVSESTGIRQKKNYDIKGRPYQQEWRNKDDNREAVNNRAKQWREANPERKYEYEKDYYIKNPEKFLEYIKNHRQHDITEAEWKECLRIFNNQCAYCGLPVEMHIVKKNGKYIIMNLHKDHVDNLGYNDIRNAVPACRSCNSRKHDSDMEKWYREQVDFSEDRYNFIMWWITEGYKQIIEDKPPYKIIKKQNEDKKTFHSELWVVDEMRNMIECIDIKDKKKDLDLTLV